MGSAPCISVPLPSASSPCPGIAPSACGNMPHRSVCSVAILSTRSSARQKRCRVTTHPSTFSRDGRGVFFGGMEGLVRPAATNERHSMPFLAGQAMGFGIESGGASGAAWTRRQVVCVHQQAQPPADGILGKAFLLGLPFVRFCLLPFAHRSVISTDVGCRHSLTSHTSKVHDRTNSANEDAFSLRV